MLNLYAVINSAFALVVPKAAVVFQLQLCIFCLFIIYYSGQFHNYFLHFSFT